MYNINIICIGQEPHTLSKCIVNPQTTELPPPPPALLKCFTNVYFGPKYPIPTLLMCFTALQN